MNPSPRDMPFSPEHVRVGIWIDSVLPAWAALSVQQLARVEGVQIVAGLQASPVDVPARAKGVAAWLKAAFLRIDRRHYPQTPDALALRSWEDLWEPGAVPPRIQCPQEQGQLASAGTEAIATLNLDVIIAYAASRPPAGLRALAKRGVAVHYLGHWGGRHADAPGLIEVIQHHDVTESGLYAMGLSPEEDRRLYTSFSTTHMTSVRASTNPIYFKMTSFASRLMRHQAASEGRASKVLPMQALPMAHDHVNDHPYRPFSPWQLAAHGASLGFRLFRRCFYFEQWSLFFHLGDGRSLDFFQFREMVPPKGCFWADPFVLNHEGRHFVFFEEYCYAVGRGHISVLEILPDGRWQNVRPVLKRPYHLSYPFLFHVDGVLYMMPETSENRSVEVYRCVAFPDAWELEATLLKDIQAVDATLLFRDGRWWLWANVQEQEGASLWDELWLFSSPQLLGGTFESHPENPVLTDVRCSRPAGALWEEDGTLCRVSQICSRKGYGYGLNINRIDELNGQAYREVPVRKVEPNWRKDVTGIHTLNHAAGCTVMDGPVWRLRFRRNAKTC